MTRAALVMAKAPVAGQSKTRLAPRFTLELAAEISVAFIRDAIAVAGSALPTTFPQRVDSIVAVSPPESSATFEQLLPGVKQIDQIGEDLGQRLAHVMSCALDQGYEQVVAINADSPTLPARFVAEAFDQLDNADVDLVLGPTEDGGYYLIGWKQPYPRVVTDVQMSTPSVLSDTLAIADSLDLSVRLLDAWYDVDEPADLDRVLVDIGNGLPCGEHTLTFLRNTGLLEP